MVKLHKHVEPEPIQDDNFDEDLSVHVGSESSEHIEPESDRKSVV